MINENSDNSSTSTLEDEMQAMSIAVHHLKALDEGARIRALSWICDFFKYNGSGLKKFTPEAGQMSNQNDAPSSTFSINNIPELFDIVDPQTGSEKALTIAYWFQVQQGHDGFNSQIINTELKNLGHGIANITTAFSDLLKNKLALQVQKSGKSQQARKVYKLTRKGILQIEVKINQTGGIE